MNKENKLLIGEIVISILLCVILIIYLNNKIEQKLVIDSDYYAYALNNLKIEEKESNKYNLYPMTDNYAEENLKDNIFTINNYGDTRKCKLMFIVSKSSTINTKNINLKINNKIFSLNNYNYEDENYFYYFIGEETINKKSSLDINYCLWLNEETDELVGNVFKYYFDVI